MSEIELPEPESVEVWIDERRVLIKPSRYTAEQVRQLIAAESERCARVCDGLKVAAASYFEINERLDEAAAAIRRG